MNQVNFPFKITGYGSYLPDKVQIREASGDKSYSFTEKLTDSSSSGKGTNTFKATGILKRIYQNLDKWNPPKSPTK